MQITGLPELVAVAATIRFRPILLTTITTLADLLPTSYGWGGSDPVLLPMTLALAWGLLIGTLTALILIPLLLIITEDLRKINISMLLFSIFS
ncbi:MAG: efflux RND transporter permease subunit [Leptospiraceae bacterium]|nr:efflux RND transporter permease subunit [Leptospiraceae bacterium]